MRDRIVNKVLRIFYRHFGKIRLPFKSKRLLIIRVDGIGDYILFRNYLSSLKASPRFANHRFTLLGNEAFKTLVEEYDANVIDDFIWVNPDIFFDTANQTLKIKLAFQLKLRCFDIAINPTHSRIWQIDEFISRAGAKKIIGSKGDDSNNYNTKKYVTSSKFYTKLINVPDTSHFEFFRNRAFIQQLTGESGKEVELKLPSDVKRYLEQVKVIIFPGARYQFRRWSTIKFSSVIREINQKSNLPLRFFIAGSNDEKYLSEEILGQLGKDIQVTDLTGLLTLPQLVDHIKGAHLLVSNETSAIHIAAAVGTTAICISNGNHFGRFNPYPVTIAPGIFTFYPDDRFYKPEYHNQLVEECRKQSELDINAIEATEVAEKAVELLLKNKPFEII